MLMPMQMSLAIPPEAPEANACAMGGVSPEGVFLPRLT